MKGTDVSELRPFEELAARFARRELEPRLLEYDEYPFADFNWPAVKAAQDTGLLTLLLPEEMGGSGQGMAALSEILFELARTDASFAAVLFVHALAQASLLRWAPKPVAVRYASKPLLAFPAYDLPTDLSPTLTAERKERGFVLSGRLEFIPLAPAAEALILPAVVKGEKETSFFVVETSCPGIRVGEPLLVLGLRGCPVADVELEGALVPEENLFCPRAESEYPALARAFSPAAAAMAAGVLQGSYERALVYAQERYQGGRMIVDYDQVRLMLVNMAMTAEAGRALVRETARAAEGGSDSWLGEAAFILVSEQASRAAADGVQCLGGYGYMHDYGQEKRMRDAKQIELIFGSAPAKRLELMSRILSGEE